jgi:Sulfite exporter TauE/SafE
MRVLWDDQGGSIQSSFFDSFRKLLESASNPVDTAPFAADWKDAVGICIAFVVRYPYLHPSRFNRHTSLIARRRPLLQIFSKIFEHFLLQVSGLANSVGIGGGLFWVPLFNALLGFSVRAAASMSQALVACGTLGGTMYSILLRHPSTYSKPLIDYSLAALLMPALVLGVSVGVLLNIITPPLIVSIVLFLILLLIAGRTLQKGIQQKRKEKADRLKHDSDTSGSEMRTLKRSSTSFRVRGGGGG